MQKAFNSIINNKFSFLQNSKILVAVSGGVDSVVLVHLLSFLKLDFSIAHCNFLLRGKESDEDANFVKNLAQQLGLTCHIKEFDTKKFAGNEGVSIQMAARELRYNWFSELIKDHNYDYVLTAHHADDHIETFFINLSRGSGLEGLSGIPTNSSSTIRPLLEFSRKQILAYAKLNKLNWREDSSNAETKYDRNYLRHKVLPNYFELKKGVKENVLKSINHIQNSLEIIDYAIQKMFEDQILINEENSLRINIESLQEKKLEATFYYILREYHFTAWDDIKDLLNSQSGKFIDSPTHRLLKDRDFLILQETTKVRHEVISIHQDDTQVKFAEGLFIFEKVNSIKEISKSICYLDASKIQFPLTIRATKEGDRFKPFGMNGSKKVSKFLKDEKKNHFEKASLKVLCDKNDNILWIINERQSEDYKVLANTARILKISFINS
ncbi:MAG: tRNA lysidine(34) synthetase TilS [bacterium]